MVATRYARHGRTWGLDTDDLSSLDYLLQYGYSQSMQDVVAGTRKSVWEELADRAAKDLGLVIDKETAKKERYRPFVEYLAKHPTYAATFDNLHESETVKTELSQLEKRHAAIIANEVGSRSGMGDDDPVGVEMRRLATKPFAAWVKAQGYTMPKDRELKRELLDEYLELNDDLFRPEAESNVAKESAFQQKLAEAAKRAVA